MQKTFNMKLLILIPTALSAASAVVVDHEIHVAHLLFEARGVVDDRVCSDGSYVVS